jgi:hypothetical protein
LLNILKEFCEEALRLRKVPPHRRMPGWKRSFWKHCPTGRPPSQKSQKPWR